MPRRYVPKTYNNRRVLRLIIGMGITFALSVVIVFLSLFFIFSRYVVDGQLIIPWLMDEMPAVTEPEATEPDEEEDPEATPPDSETTNIVFPDTVSPNIESPFVIPPGDEDLNTYTTRTVDPDDEPPDDD